LNRHANWRWRGVHTVWERAADRADRLPVLLIHGWPGGPIEFRVVARRDEGVDEPYERWLRGGFHLLVQGATPDALAVGLADSPGGLAAWLVEKYRRWSDCDGDVERRFSKDDLRWRLAPGERVAVPAAAADFPAEIIRPPREWTARVLGDLRRWTEFDRGGHFAGFEEPDLLGDHLLAFLAELCPG
jgi:hypothetical protein